MSEVKYYRHPKLTNIAYRVKKNLITYICEHDSGINIATDSMNSVLMTDILKHLEETSEDHFKYLLLKVKDYYQFA